jgi:hypothetical protein
VRAVAPVEDLIAGPREDPSLVLASWQTIRIRSALGLQLRQTSRVLIRPPRWMPRWLYQMLMRSIVVDVDPLLERRVLATETTDHTPRRGAAKRPRRVVAR